MKKDKKKQRKPIRFQKAVMFFNVPINVKCQFKAYCSRRGRSMTEMIIQMMQLAYRQDKRAIKKKYGERK